MADKVSATISYVDANNRKGMKAITDINPNADNAAVKTLCAGLNALTTNTLQGVEKIERTDITNATTKPKVEIPDFSGGNLLLLKENPGGSRTLSSAGNFPNFTYYVDMPSNWDDNVVLMVYNQKTSAALLKLAAYVGSSISGSTTGEATITVHFEETETTAATTAVMTIPVTGIATLTIL